MELRSQSEKRFEKQIELISGLFDEWLDKQNNLLEVGMKEALGNAFFDAYLMGQIAGAKRIVKVLEEANR